jgi:hypothetical protein
MEIENIENSTEFSCIEGLAVCHTVLFEYWNHNFIMKSFETKSSFRDRVDFRYIQELFV